MIAYRKQRSAVAAAATASMFILVMLGSDICAAAASVTSLCPFPLEKGTKWVYEGKVEWTAPGSAKVRTANIRWVSEVHASFTGTNVRAAVVSGFPDELAWYEPGQTPGFCVPLIVKDRVYRFETDGKNQATRLARRLAENPLALAGGGEKILQWPLTVGRKWGQDPVREDTWYCWCVEQVETRALSIKGLTGSPPLKIYQLAYRTCPDHQLVDVAPGLGVVRFVYAHSKFLFRLMCVWSRSAGLVAKASNHLAKAYATTLAGRQSRRCLRKVVLCFPSGFGRAFARGGANAAVTQAPSLPVNQSVRFRRLWRI